MYKREDMDVLKWEEDMKWVPAHDGEFPNGAIVAGFQEGDAALVCRGNVTQHSLTVFAPGKLVAAASAEGCLIAWSGEKLARSYEVLIYGNKQ